MFLVRKYRREVSCNSSEKERRAWELRDLETWSGRVDWGRYVCYKERKLGGHDLHGSDLKPPLR
jgi:hypothetical protein